jgi:restriction endonuclease Mrr
VGKADWFQFEREVMALMKNEWFEVHHVAASRSGDKGIDVYASKGHDLEQINWVIQCKCHSPHRHVGPEKVRELLGVLFTMPPGTRGMLITTSAFSSGARELALDHNIRLMDGIEFTRRTGRGPGG